MHDIWNPWHGCVKCSEGCKNCYMYYLDAVHGLDGANIYKTVSGFKKPLSKTKNGDFKIKSGETVRVCMTSDFFLEQADLWRDEAWAIMRSRPDVIFYLLTKRPERIKDHLPLDWGDGWENISMNVTCENQVRADERIPILLDLPAKHKGLMAAPFIGPVHIDSYLASGQIDQVMCGGENYNGARICNFDWVKDLRAECVAHNVKFTFLETGTAFVKDGRLYRMPDKRLQSRMAHKSGMNFPGKPISYKLIDGWGRPIPEDKLYKPFFWERCFECGGRPTCNGCSRCGKCRIPD